MSEAARRSPTASKPEAGFLLQGMIAEYHTLFSPE